MKLLVITILMLFTCYWVSVCHADSIYHCDQVVYDQVYRQLILQAIETMDIHQKIEAVHVLRSLCNGQKSTYETGKTKKNP